MRSCWELEAEAERLVRQRESWAETSRRLDVSVKTPAGWALRGGWRKKDLDHERSREATQKTLLAIRNGNRAVDAQVEMRAQLAAMIREAVALLADGGEEAKAKLERIQQQQLRTSGRRSLLDNFRNRART